jgi:hypothetical protein
MPKRFLLATAAVALLTAGIVIGVIVREPDRPHPTGPYNAVFHVGPTGDIGFWIYAERGSCPELRAKDKRPIVVIVPPTFSGKASLRELKTCMELNVSDPKTPQIVHCIDAFMTATDQRAKEWSGTYSVTLADGRQVSGGFQAMYCEPG